jgi:hypothetical protein
MQARFRGWARCARGQLKCYAIRRKGEETDWAKIGKEHFSEGAKSKLPLGLKYVNRLYQNNGNGRRRRGLRLYEGLLNRLWR